MANFKSTEMRFLESVFDMGGGYVLDFSDRTIGLFFLEELNIDIDHEMFMKEGTSRAKRLRWMLDEMSKGPSALTIRACLTLHVRE